MVRRPTIAGKNLANPHGTILSSAFMLRWLADRHGDRVLADAASRIERAVAEVLASGAGRTPDIGGTAGTTEATTAVCEALQSAC